MLTSYSLENKFSLRASQCPDNVIIIYNSAAKIKVLTSKQ